MVATSITAKPRMTAADGRPDIMYLAALILLLEAYPLTLRIDEHSYQRDLRRTRHTKRVDILVAVHVGVTAAVAIVSCDVIDCLT